LVRDTPTARWCPAEDRPAAAVTCRPYTMYCHAVTYAMRYLLKMISNIAVGEADDDGNAAGGEVKFLSEAQVKRIKADLDATKSDIAMFGDHFGLDSIDKIAADKHERIKAAIARSASRWGCDDHPRLS